MKHLLLLVLMLLCIPGHSQDELLPEEVESAFQAMYPEVRIQGWWEDEELYYLEFTIKGHSYTALFGINGSWMETAEVISEMELPPALQTFLKNKLPSGDISYCEGVENAGDEKYIRVFCTDASNTLFTVRSDMQGGNIEVLETIQRP